MCWSWHKPGNVALQDAFSLLAAYCHLKKPKKKSRGNHMQLFLFLCSVFPFLVTFCMSKKHHKAKGKDQILLFPTLQSILYLWVSTETSELVKNFDIGLMLIWIFTFVKQHCQVLSEHCTGTDGRRGLALNWSTIV